MAFHTFDIVYPGEFLLFESNARTIWLNITLQVRKTPSFCAIFALKTIIFTKTGSGHKHKENSKKRSAFSYLARCSSATTRPSCRRRATPAVTSTRLTMHPTRGSGLGRTYRRSLRRALARARALGLGLGLAEPPLVQTTAAAAAAASVVVVVAAAAATARA